MANNYGTACEVFKTFLECAQGVDIDVVGRFVEQKHVAFFLERHCEVQTVALAA